MASQPSSKPSTRLFQARHAVPMEHGAWIWWIGPLAVGAAAAHHLTWDWAVLAMAVLAAFLLRQPATMLAMAAAGRGLREDVLPSTLWAGLYATTLCLAGGILAVRGHTNVFLLAGIAAPFFPGYLWLVGTGRDRRKTLLEIAAAALLALAAPAAYWVCGGADPNRAWVLWFICATQSAASVSYIVVRLGLSRLTEKPALGGALRAGLLPLTHAFLNLAAAAVLVLTGLTPWPVAAGFAAILAENIEGIGRPPAGTKAAWLGVRQLTVSVVFFLIAAVAYMI